MQLQIRPSLDITATVIYPFITRIDDFPQIEEGMSKASLLVEGTTITTNAIDLTGTTVDSTTTYVDQPFDAESKKDK